MSHIPAPSDTPPSDWIARFAPLIAPNARVLDLACGRGRHAHFLARRGARVLAVDHDLEALHACAGVSTVEVLHTDIEAADADLAWLADSTFDAIIVTRYLHRPLLPRLPAALRPGGLLLYETFMAGHELYGRPNRPAFLLRPNELLTLAADAGMTVLAFEQGRLPANAPAIPSMLQRLAACRLSPAEAEARAGTRVAPSSWPDLPRYDVRQ